MRTVQGRIVQLAQHKYASNVVEKCVEKSGEADRRIVVLVSQIEGGQENSRLGESERNASRRAAKLTGESSSW
jgi:hypothetical protein